jgi:hypothetical protein
MDAMDDLTAFDLLDIEARLDAFSAWFARVVDAGGSYDREEALADWKRVEADQRRLIEQARARA